VLLDGLLSLHFFSRHFPYFFFLILNLDLQLADLPELLLPIFLRGLKKLIYFFHFFHLGQLLGFQIFLLAR
jgi:hypothetical protein